MTSPPRLFVLTDTTLASPPDLFERCERTASLSRPGSVVFILRDKMLPARERLALGAALGERVRGHGQLLGVAERLDLALLLEADAVHLGEADVGTEDARRLMGGRVLVSRACHDPDQAPLLETDALLLSPILAPRKGRPAHGLAAIARARELAPRRLIYALGGIDADNAARCLGAGADGVAAIGAVLKGDPAALVAALGLDQPEALNHS